MPGVIGERCLWQIQRGDNGAAVGRKTTLQGSFRRVPQEGLQSNFDPFCPCQSRRGLCIVRDDFFFLKSHRLAHAVAPPLPKKSLTFRGPHKFAAQPCGFEPFFFCSLSLAHGPFCRILIPKTGADFPSGGILLQ